MRRTPGIPPQRTGREGFALIVVLLVLLALLVLCAPFLLGARNAERSSTELADRIEARVLLDGAARHARAVLGDTHPALDRTPYYDSLDELKVGEDFPPEFLRPNDPRGEMWRAEAQDVSGRIDLDSAPPQLFANLLGMSSRFTRPIKPDDKEKDLPVSSTRGFEPSGMVWCDGELIRYGKLGESGFETFVRGVGSTSDKWFGGPRPPATHAAGAPVFDQRAFAVPLWRAAGPEGALRELDEIGTLRECGEFALAKATEGSAAQAIWEGAILAPLFEQGSVYARARQGERWQHPVRLAASVSGGKEGRIRLEPGGVRWINPGTTLQVYDGTTRETALAVEVDNTGTVYLDRILQNDYSAWRAEVRVLARRPVNLNTASREVLIALFTNLQVRGRNARIVKDEAETLADVVIESRPLTGWEDFLRRVVMPSCGLEKLPNDAPVVPRALAAGNGFLDELDALALYRNGLNANDSELAFSTLPFAFRSSDVYALELRSTVNAESGAERFNVVREQVEVIVPQRRLMQLWTTQEDYDDELRLTGNAPWWMSAPSATSMFDVLGSNPPSRLAANWGTYKGRLFLPGSISAQGAAPEDLPKNALHVFASRDNTAWIQLWPARLEESGRRQGRVIHFDHETRDPEGRYLPDEPVVRAPNDKLVNWVTPAQVSSGNTGGAGSLMLPAAGSLWIKPRSKADACILDVAGGTPGSDRLGLFFEKGDLVLRVWDGTGDHSGTTEMEVGEARYAMDAGQDAPGMPLDVWSHVAFDVRGTRPDQIALFVNGKTHGVRTPGLTRLAANLDPTTTQIRVESILGFPQRGVVRIGDELVEYTLGANNVLDATPIAAGPYAGFGGRLARERTLLQNGARVPEILYGANGSGQAPANVGTHLAGTSVELFGYSMPLRSQAPSGASNLPVQLGPFLVGIVSKAVAGSSSQAGEPITLVLPPPLIGSIPLGFGLDGSPSTVTALEIKPADTETSQAQLMSAFNPSGGWLLLAQVNLSRLTPQTLPGQPPGNPINQPHTAPPHNALVGGAEFIWYTGVQGNQLLLDMNRRGNSTGFKNLGIGRDQRAFIVDWSQSILLSNPDDPTQYVDPDTRLEYEVFVLPISVPCPGAASHFLDPRTSQPPVQIQTNNTTVAKYVSEYAQFVESQQAERTEWVRYDEINSEHLVRNEDGALRSLFGALTRRGYDDITEGQAPVGPGGGGGGGGTGGTGTGGTGAGGLGGTGGGAPLAMLSPSASAPTAAAQSTTGSYWNEEVGKPETYEGPITRAARSFLQFRGVFGTFSHPHASGTPIVPVVRIFRRAGSASGTSQAEPDAGRPGCDDAIFFVEQDPVLLGNPARVQRAYLPSQYITYRWKQSAPNTMTSIDSGGTGMKYFVPVDNPIDGNAVYVGLREALPAPYPFDPIASGMGGTSGATALPDMRLRYRITKHPSGERPRIVTGLRVGGAVAGAQAGAVPSAVIDELAFSDEVFARTAPNLAPESAQGALLWLTQESSSTTTDFYVAPGGIRPAGDVFFATNEYLNELPDDAGLLRIGDEVLCYSSRTPSDGHIQVATAGRGLLGTRPQPHHAHEGVQWLEDSVVSVLDGDCGPNSPTLSLASSKDFPSEGLVLVDDELIHYTRIEGNTLAMPRASSKPGAMDHKGDPLFRGRFGSVRAAHSTGTPVILFPFRYWDRWTEYADAPELAHFDLGIDQPSAWWESCFFFKTDVAGAKIGILQRTDPDVPWDADPEKDPRLALYWQGDHEGAPLTIGHQTDSIRWRVFVKYGPDAFDPSASTRFGWRQTPRLDRFGAFYYAPDTVLRSVER